PVLARPARRRARRVGLRPPRPRVACPPARGQRPSTPVPVGLLPTRPRVVCPPAGGQRPSTPELPVAPGARRLQHPPAPVPVDTSAPPFVRLRIRKRTNARQA